MVEKFLIYILSLSTSDMISLVACIISILAAIVSFVSYRLSKKEYNLQMKLYTEGLSNYNFEIVDSFLVDDNKSEKIQYWFNLLIVNISDKQTSIMKYELRLECLNNIIFKPEFALERQDEENISFLELPQNIDAHSSIRGWCIFELPRKLYKSLAIEKQTLLVKDIHEKKVEKEAIYIKEEVVNYDV